jgi:hypothetical protein
MNKRILAAFLFVGFAIFAPTAIIGCSGDEKPADTKPADAAKPADAPKPADAAK